MRSTEVAKGTSDREKSPRVVRRAGQAVVKFFGDASERSKAADRAQARTLEASRNESKNRAAVDTAKAETDKRPDASGDLARLFSKVTTAQTRSGRKVEEMRIAFGAQDEVDSTLRVETRGLIVEADDGLLRGRQSGLVLGRDMGFAPEGRDISLGREVEVSQVGVVRAVETNPDTDTTQEKLSLILEGTYIEKGRWSHDSMLTATIDHSAGAEPVWTQSTRATARGSAYNRNEVPTWGAEFTPTPETVAAAIGFVDQLVRDPSQ